MKDRKILNQKAEVEEKVIEKSLRPQKLNEFIGGNRKNYIKRLLADIYQKFGKL